MYPTHFKLGNTRRKLTNPAVSRSEIPGAEVFQGKVEDYDFRHQSTNFLRIQKILREAGNPLTFVCGAFFSGDGGYYRSYKPASLHQFVAGTENHTIFWNKYEGLSAGGGKNGIFFAGYEVYTSSFLDMPPHRQQALASGNEVLIRLTFGDDFYAYRR